MLRGLIEEILLFLTPFVLFALWLGVTRRNPLDVAHWSGVRFALTVTGLLLAIGSFLLAWALAPRERGVYIPPSFVDGELRPGRFSDRP